MKFDRLNGAGKVKRQPDSGYEAGVGLTNKKILPRHRQLTNARSVEIPTLKINVYFLSSFSDDDQIC